MNGSEDAILTATSYLNDRLNKLFMERRKRGDADPRPGINDILNSHLMYMVSEYRPHVAVVHEYFKTSKEGGGSTFLIDGNTANRVRFNLNGNNGHFLHDQVVHVVFEELGDANDTSPTATKFRFCDYPGVRLFRHVSLKADGVDVDDYTSDDVVFDQNLDIGSDKTGSWMENIGQEQTKYGEYYNKDLRIKQVLAFKDGAQTFRPYQKALEMWIPLRFHHNLDVKHSLHNSLIHTLDKYVDINLESLNRIVQAADENNNVLPNYFSGKRVQIKTMDLYSRNIYINPEIHDLLCRRRLVSLIRIRRRHVENLNKSEGQILFSQLKYQIEHVSFGFRPDSNLNSFTNWHKFAKINTTEFPVPVIINNPAIIPIQQLVVRTATYDSCEKVIDKLGLSVYGNVLYPLMNEKFFNSYMAFTVPDSEGGAECGIYQIPFSQLRSSPNLNGYINNSEAREVYLKYISSYISASQPVTFHAVARCINFLIYKDGHIKLKYIT